MTPQRVAVEATWFVPGKGPERRPMQGWTTSVPGIVVVGERGRWQAIHQASGLVMEKGLRSRRAAMEWVAQLGDVVDWTLPAEKLVKLPGYFDKVRAALHPDERPVEPPVPVEDVVPLPQLITVVPEEPSPARLADLNAQIQRAGHRARLLEPSACWPGWWTTWCGVCQRGLYVRGTDRQAGSLRLDECS